MTLEDGFQIGDWRVEPRRGRVEGPKDSRRLEPKAMAVLLELASHPGQVRSRQQIHDAVWPRGHITDDTLTRCIGQLRKALSDDPRSPRYLETIPRRGYRLIAPVAPLTLSKRVAAPAEQPAESLLVLPLQNLMGARHEDLADGMTELLIARLGSLRGLHVLSRTTAMRYKGADMTVPEIARATGVRWVFEGSMLRSQGRLQVVAQLIDAAADTHVWADDYLRELGDLLTLQNDIAREIAAAVKARFDEAAFVETEAGEMRLSESSMRDYLLARNRLSQRTPASLTEALERLSRVCEAEPAFAEAWAYRARTRVMLTHYGQLAPAMAGDACRADVARALTLQPELGMGFCVRGVIRLNFDWDPGGAEGDLIRGLELHPSDSLTMLALANCAAVRGEFAEAKHWIERARELEPFDLGICMNVGDHAILRRDFPAAVEALERSLRIDPRHRPSALRLAWAQALAGDGTAAMATLRELHNPDDPDDWQWHEYAAIVKAAAGDASDAAKHYAEVQRIHHDRFVPKWSLARAAAAAKADQQAIDWLRAAEAEHSTSIPYLGVTPAFDALRHRADFRSLLQT